MLDRRLRKRTLPLPCWTALRRCLASSINATPMKRGTGGVLSFPLGGKDHGRFFRC